MATAKAKIKSVKKVVGSTNELVATFAYNRNGTKKKYKDNIDGYTVQWNYKVYSGSTSTTKWISGAENTVGLTPLSDTYTIPDNAIYVRVRAKPNRKSDKVHPAVGYGSWKQYNVSKLAPDEPGTPTIEVDGVTITVSVDNVDTSAVVNAATKVEFNLVNATDGTRVGSDRTVTLSYNAASTTYTGSRGKKYKARVRAVDKNGNYSSWSDYTDEVLTAPEAPTNLSVEAGSKTSAVLSWTKTSTADHYTIEYISSENVIGNNITFDTTSVESLDTDSNVESYTVTGMESGATYYFRIKSVDEDSQESDWHPSSGYPSCTLGTAPSAPTTWSSTTTAMVGETVRLYWVHNSEDGSSQTKAELELSIGTSTSVVTLSSDDLVYTDSDETTSYYDVPTDSYAEGVSIDWRVRTWGVLTGDDDVSPWSIQRTIDIYAQPTLEVSILDLDGNAIEKELESFPFYILLSAGPNTQTPVGYQVDIVPQESYETFDRTGEEVTVNAGDSVYSGYHSLSDYTPSIEMTPDLVDLEPDVSYSVSCTLYMDSGLTADAETSFTVLWEDETYSIDMDFEYVSEGYYALLRPYCYETEILYNEVEFSYTDSSIEIDYYVDTETSVEITSGTIVDDAYTIDNEDVYYGFDSDGNEIYYCLVEGDDTIVSGVTLSVYRREFDGSYTEVQSGIVNSEASYIVDPHPSLDQVSYRIVAISDSTGAISYTDSSPETTGETSAIIQWDEGWDDITDVDAENDNLELAESSYTANVLVLPYNIDVSDQNDPDVEFADYIGRKRPVSYYGTHINETSKWSAEIPKYDTDTLYAIRNLSVWMGDCYVREPSGTGYHANVQVSYDVSHNELTIPVTLDITRVEGGA